MINHSSMGDSLNSAQQWFMNLMETITHNGELEKFYEDHCTYLPAMLGWFLFSALLSSYNKFVFGKGHMEFPCPLLLTSIHFLLQWWFATLVCRFFPEETGSERVDRMTWKEWRGISIPCGVVTSGDVGLSNLSMVTISITFYTMVKSSAPVFVLTWAYLFGLERITWPLIGVVVVIAAGEFLTVAGEADFDLNGFLMCLGASFLSGARWTLVQLRLQSLDPPIKSTIAVMKLLAPSMFWSLLLLSMAARPWDKLQYDPTQDEDYDPEADIDYQSAYHKQLVRVLVLGTLGASLAILMILCEFYLILHSSAIILMIGGVLKEMITIMIGVSFFGDKLNMVNILGCMVVFSGVVSYKMLFHMGKQDSRGEFSGLIPDDADSEGPCYIVKGVELSDRCDSSQFGQYLEELPVARTEQEDKICKDREMA